MLLLLLLLLSLGVDGHVMRRDKKTGSAGGRAHRGAHRGAHCSDRAWLRLPRRPLVHTLFFLLARTWRLRFPSLPLSVCRILHTLTQHGCVRRL